jgi:hypothetical protein
MKIRTEITPSRHLWLPAVALSFGLMLLAWSAGHAYGEGGSSNPNPTTTALDCSPASAEVGQSVHCTATVSGVIATDSGEVVFKSENAGQLSARSCELSFAAKGTSASCSVDYVPGADGVAQQRLHAIYVGDEANESSEAIFALVILGGGGGGEEEAGGGEEGGGEEKGGGEEGSGEEESGEEESGGGEEGDGGGKGTPTPTTTALDCSPASAEVGESVHCTATVSGVIGTDSGEVVFKSENAGLLSARSCELSFAAKGAPASCGIDYVPAADGSAQQRLHAIYLGDEANESSKAIFALTILAAKGGGGEEGSGGGEENDGGGKGTPRPKAKTHRRAHRRCHCGSARNGARTSKHG